MLDDIKKTLWATADKPALKACFRLLRAKSLRRSARHAWKNQNFVHDTTNMSKK
ncbi:MAG: hypothetical protein Q7T97_17515 [Burkholderiaceae bacterium]|nr:hypothetical protein [Burkholderiaceae bacterium]